MNWSRVLEPEVMDTPAEAADYDQMDHRAVNGAFVAELMAAGPLGGQLLDLGTGTARIPILLCQQLAHVHVVGVDLSRHMLAVGTHNLAAAGLAARVQLERIDAKQLPYADGRFSTVMSNSIVHHIPDPTVVLREAVRVTAPGGLLFFRDLLRPANSSRWQQLVDQYAGCETAHARQMFADSLRAALTLDEIRTMVEGLGFPRETVQATSDRHWTWCARKDTGSGQASSGDNR